MFHSHPLEIFTTMTKNLNLSPCLDSLIDHFVLLKMAPLNPRKYGNPAVVTVIFLQKCLQLNIGTDSQTFYFWEHFIVTNCWIHGWNKFYFGSINSWILSDAITYVHSFTESVLHIWSTLTDPQNGIAKCQAVKLSSTQFINHYMMSLH